jgi:plastocyanin
MTSDEELDHAIATLREAGDDDSLTPRLQADTVAALRRAEGGTARFGIRIAVAVVIVAGVLAVYVSLRPSAPKVVTVPPAPPPPRRSAPEPSSDVPQTAPAAPERRMVENVAPRTPPEPRTLPPKTPVVIAGQWSITGTVRFDGEPPEWQQIEMSAVKECAAQHPNGAFEEDLVVHDGLLANVVVYVKPASGQVLLSGPRPTKPAVLDQRGCQYRPHVLAVQVGQPLVVTNSDTFLHNVHALSIDNPVFNFGQPTKDTNGRKVDPLNAPEVFKVKCDVHPWMSAYIHVIEHPFFAVTSEGGTYAIPAGLPDGEYTLVAWHEKLGEKEISVELKGGKAERADFTFDAR